MSHFRDIAKSVDQGNKGPCHINRHSPSGLSLDDKVA